MAAIELSISAAVQIAWKIAAGSARLTGQDIGVEHFLYGIVSLESIGAGNVPAAQKDAVETEINELREVCRSVGIGLQDVRRKLREVTQRSNDPGAAQVPSVSTPTSRSVAVRQAFERAAVPAIGGGAAHVELLKLTYALLRDEPNAPLWLGVDRATCKTLIAKLANTGDESAPTDEFPDTAVEGMSIFQSLDAEATADSKVNWSAIGEPLGLICELCWQAGTSSKMESLLEASVQILLKAVPAAEHAAVLMLDSCGELLLKAHAPRGTMRVSTVSARKAIDQRESFIWQRGQDLSASQLESDLQAGLYAPVLAAGEVFGVLCLDAQSSASEFTEENLLLATSVGHQLGLTMANRRLEEDLCLQKTVMERLLTNFSPKVRERLLLKAQAGRLKLGGERSVVSVLASDIRGFTLLTAHMDAEEVVGMLNDYFSAMVAVVFKHGGSIDKFIGDALLAVFGSPEADALHAEKSLRAALEMQVEIERVSKERKRIGLPDCCIGIGVHTGEVIHGFIGSPERMEFTVIGNTVNLASRYCDAAGAGQVIMSAEMLERVWKQAIVEPVEIKTKHEGSIAAYRLVEMKPGK